MKDMNCDIPKVEGYGLIPLVANALNYLFITPDCESVAPVSAAVPDMVEVADNVTKKAPIDITVAYDSATGKFVPHEVSEQYMEQAKQIADNAKVITSSEGIVEAVKSAKIIEPKSNYFDLLNNIVAPQETCAVGEQMSEIIEEGTCLVENAVEEGVCALEKVAEVSLFENITETANQTCDAITKNPGAAVAIAAAAVVVIGGFLGSWLWSRKPAKLQAEIDDEEMAESFEYFRNLDEDEESEDESELDENFGFLKFQEKSSPDLDAKRQNLERGIEDLKKKMEYAAQKGKEAQEAMEEVRAATPSYESKTPTRRRITKIHTRATTDKDTILGEGTKVQKPVNDPYGTSAAAVSIAHSYKEHKRAKGKEDLWDVKSVSEIMVHLGLNANGSFPKDESARLRAIAKLDKFYKPGEGDDKETAVRELPRLN